MWSDAIDLNYVLNLALLQVYQQQQPTKVSKQPIASKIIANSWAHFNRVANFSSDCSHIEQISKIKNDIIIIEIDIMKIQTLGLKKGSHISSRKSSFRLKSVLILSKLTEAV